MKIQVDAFTKAKNPDNNEDAYGNNDNTFIVADGSTDKSGKSFAGQTPGKLAAELFVEECLKVDFTGIELVRHLTKVLREKLANLATDDQPDTALPVGASLICAKIIGDDLIITQSDDSHFRINEKDIYLNVKLIDTLNAEARSIYIQHTGDVERGREYIMPILQNQHIYANNPNHPLGFADINGTEVPEKFIKVHKFPLKDLQTLEIFSDGYYKPAEKPTIDSWEQAHAEVEQEDPDKWKKYKSTKSTDDRTVMIVRFS